MNIFNGFKDDLNNLLIKLMKHGEMKGRKQLNIKVEIESQKKTQNEVKLEMKNLGS